MPGPESTAQSGERGWGIKLVERATLPEINNWLKLPVGGGDSAPCIMVGLDSSGSRETSYLLEFNQEGQPVKLWYGISGEISLVHQAVVMGGDYPYHVLIVDPLLNDGYGKRIPVIELSSMGMRGYFQSLDDAPKHIRTAAELTSESLKPD